MGGGREEGREADEFGQLGHQGLTKRQLDGFVWSVKKRAYSWVALCWSRGKEKTTKSELRDAQTGDRDAK